MYKSKHDIAYMIFLIQKSSQTINFLQLFVTFPQLGIQLNDFPSNVQLLFFFVEGYK